MSCGSPLHLIEEIWKKLFGNSGLVQSMRLTMWHFVKDSYSQINVALATLVLSGFVKDMISADAKDDSIVLQHAKSMHTYAQQLCVGIGMRWWISTMIRLAQAHLRMLSNGRYPCWESLNIF
jgi:hypothetical protein